MAREILDPKGSGSSTLLENLKRTNRNFAELNARTRRVYLDLASFHVHDDLGSHLPGTAADDDLGLADSGATSFHLYSVAANNSSVSAFGVYPFPLPGEYVDAGAITVGVRAKAGGDVEVEQSVDLIVLPVDEDGAVGADVCATAKQTLTTSYANYTFDLTETGLVRGSILLIEPNLIMNDTGGTADESAFISQVWVDFASTAFNQ